MKTRALASTTLVAYLLHLIAFMYCLFVFLRADSYWSETTIRQNPPGMKAREHTNMALHESCQRENSKVDMMNMNKVTADTNGQVSVGVKLWVFIHHHVSCMCMRDDSIFLNLVCAFLCAIVYGMNLGR